MRIRTGIVGVGNAWESRHLPALRALADRFEVCAVCDPVRRRAELTARTLGACVHDGFRALTRRSDLEAVLLLSARWFGALPIYAACDAGKAVYCSAALELRDEQAAELRNRVRESGIAFMAEFPCRLSPATLRLKELIATRLGAPRLVFCNRRRSTPKSTENGERCELDLVELIDWCRYVVDRDPTSLVCTEHRNPKSGVADYIALNLDFSHTGETGAGPAAMVTCGQYVAKAWDESLPYRRPADMKIVCERGVAFVDLPSTVAWFDAAGQHLETLEHDRPVGEQLLLHFHRAVESLVLKSSSLDDAHLAISLANKARISSIEGRRIHC